MEVAGLGFWPLPTLSCQEPTLSELPSASCWRYQTHLEDLEAINVVAHAPALFLPCSSSAALLIPLQPLS